TGVMQREHDVDLLAAWLTPATVATFSGDGRWLATVSNEDPQSVRLIDTTTGKVHRTMGGVNAPAPKGRQVAVYQLPLSRDGGRLATCSAHANPEPYRELKVWDTNTGRLLVHGRIPGPITDRLYGGLALSADGELIAIDAYPPGGVGQPGKQDPS